MNLAGVSTCLLPFRIDVHDGNDLGSGQPCIAVRLTRHEDDADPFGFVLDVDQAVELGEGLLRLAGEVSGGVG